MTVFPAQRQEPESTLTRIIVGGGAAITTLVFLGSLLIDSVPPTAQSWHLWNLGVSAMCLWIACMIESPKGILFQTICTIVGACTMLTGLLFLAVYLGLF